MNKILINCQSYVIEIKCPIYNFVFLKFSISNMCKQYNNKIYFIILKYAVSFIHEHI